MTLLAQRYLGNCTTDPSLQHQLHDAEHEGYCIHVELTPEDCIKSRISVESTTGIPVGIIKERGWTLSEGDVFETEQDALVIVHVQHQEVMVLSFPDEPTGCAIHFVHLGYTLGNHHWPMCITNNKIYVQLVVDRKVIETTLHHIQIPGLKIDYEVRSPDRPVSFQMSHTHP